jgi:hypothetical protein
VHFHDSASDRAGPLPAPPPALMSALAVADFANPASMQALELEVTTYARALRASSARQPVVESTVRAVVDDSLPRRVLPIRTSEDRTRLLALTAAWSAAPNL